MPTEFVSSGMGATGRIQATARATWPRPNYPFPTANEEKGLQSEARFEMIKLCVFRHLSPAVVDDVLSGINDVKGHLEMGELAPSSSIVIIPCEVRKETTRVQKKLVRAKASCTALAIKADWCKKLRTDATRRNATTIREIASAPNFLLLAALCLFGTSACWIIGDLLHWFLGIIFAAVGLCVSFFVVLRVAFNATLFSDEQLERIQDASVSRMNALNTDVATLEAELARLKPLVDAEVQYEQEMKGLLAEKGAEALQKKKEVDLNHRIEAHLRRSGTAPTERQLQFAKHLGMKICGRESKEELSLLIDRVLARQTPAEEVESKRRWMETQHQTAFAEIQDAIQSEVDDALQMNRQLGEVFVTGFVVVRGEDCGRDHHGTFVRIGDIHSQKGYLPPFKDCNYYNCGCEIIQVMKGETAKKVFLEYTA